ncbi:cell division protein PerM, partial [Angustibacter aerolatus]
MSLLDRTRTHDHASGVERARARAGEATGIVMALLTGLWTAAISWLAIALPVLLVWAASAQTTATWGQATRLATQGWLLLHHVAVDVPGGRVSVVPLGLSLVPLGLCWLAGRRMGTAADDAGGVASLLTPLAGFAAGYALPVLVAGLVAHGDGVGPAAWQALPAWLLVGVL